ncbi:MAG: hypothetical protein ACI9LO_003203 [Planctomycetota bacterium]|jgi:uncharacterized protein (DUF934 family)
MDSLRFTQAVVSSDEWLRRDDAGRVNGHYADILVLKSDLKLIEILTSVNHFSQLVVLSTDFNDGRIFSIGRQLRLSGYQGHLTLVGAILPDQFFALKSCDYDDVLVLQDFQGSPIVDLELAQSLDSYQPSLFSKLEKVVAAGNNPWQK